MSEVTLSRQVDDPPRVLDALRRGSVSSAVSSLVVAALLVVGIADGGRSAYVSLAAGLAVASLGLVVVSGWARQVHLGQYAFMGVGAFAASGASSAPFGVRAAIGILGAAVLAVPVGLAASRLRGLALGALTLLVGLTVWSLALTPDVMAVVDADTFLGVAGARPSFASTDRAYAVFATVVALGALGVLLLLRSTRSGRAMAGLGTSRAALVATGWSPRTLVVCSFAVAAAFGGLGGVLVAGGYGSINANDIVPLNSVVLWAFLFNFGADRAAAAMLAPALLAGLSAAGVGGDALALLGAAGLIMAGTTRTRGILNDVDDRLTR